MSNRFTLPSGAWVELRDPHTLLRGDKKRLLQGLPETENMVYFALEMVDGLLALLVVAWSYELPLPSQDPKSLELLPIGDDEALSEGVEPARLLIFPEQPDETSQEQREDPASPTEPSAG
ncbi:hypothetical protein JHN59_08610 [Streptomyces sp. MBT49]|uniref:hypothetical protein n=1 Tax=unclassified Streptomyces TaxID=2593676 RepID=UPI00190C2374|nr:MULTISPECIES: hypothetical protein [unclassified Streptomyces]MBK3624908.1 hypothetical protein [Streptomyces sp. MBT49]MBK3632552.1 hypothetical protein [Streptomyces sp. MBT97]